MRIIFMGTPQFAVASLDALLLAGCDIVAVVTSPDKPAGRGKKLQESAVKQYAVKNGIKVLQPENLKSQEFSDQLKALKADLQVVVAFRMLPEAVWNMPAKGTLNLHASLLPQYRGAAPINWVLINGEKESGVTTFFLKHEIDTGNILFTEKVTLTGHETSGELHDRLMEKGAGLIVKTVKGIESGRYNEHPQAQLMEGAELKPAPKIFKEDCIIDWNKPAESIYNKIRGLSPMPGAYTMFKDKTLKIYKAEFRLENHDGKAGDFLSDNKNYLSYLAKDGVVNLVEVQLEGKKAMDIKDFLRGIKI